MLPGAWTIHHIVAGDFFRPPFVSETMTNANGWNGFPEAYSAMYQQQLNESTPNDKQLHLNWF